MHACMPLSGSPRSDQHSHLYAAAAWMMRNTLLDQLTFQVRSQQVKWLVDDSIAYHLTLSLDGWSNARMESIYSWNIIFPDRRVMLLRSDDLSSISHTGENLASKAVFMKACLPLLLLILLLCCCNYYDIVTIVLPCRTCHCRDHQIWPRQICCYCD